MTDGMRTVVQWLLARLANALAILFLGLIGAALKYEFVSFGVVSNTESAFRMLIIVTCVSVLFVFVSNMITYYLSPRYRVESWLRLAGFEVKSYREESKGELPDKSEGNISLVTVETASPEEVSVGKGRLVSIKFMKKPFFARRAVNIAFSFVPHPAVSAWLQRAQLADQVVVKRSLFEPIWAIGVNCRLRDKISRPAGNRLVIQSVDYIFWSSRITQDDFMQRFYRVARASELISNWNNTKLLEIQNKAK